MIKNYEKYHEKVLKMAKKEHLEDFILSYLKEDLSVRCRFEVQFKAYFEKLEKEDEEKNNNK